MGRKLNILGGAVLLGALGFGLSQCGSCTKKPEEPQKHYFQVRDIAANTYACDELYTVKKGDNLTGIARGAYGLDPCNDNAIVYEIHRIQNANRGALAHQPLKVVNEAAEPCDKNGNRKTNVISDGDDGLKDFLAVGQKLNIPKTCTKGAYQTNGSEVAPEDLKEGATYFTSVLDGEGSEHLRLIQYRAPKKTGWESFKDNYLNFSSDTPAEEAPTADDLKTDASDSQSFDKRFSDYLNQHPWKAVGGALGIIAVSAGLTYAIIRRVARPGPSPPAGGPSPRAPLNRSTARGRRSDGISHTYAGSARAESTGAEGANTYFDAGDTSLLEYIGRSTSKFDRKAAQEAGAYDSIRELVSKEYKTKSAREVRSHLDGLGIKMSETTIRKLAREELGAEYTAIASARKSASRFKSKKA